MRPDETSTRVTLAEYILGFTARDSLSKTLISAAEASGLSLALTIKKVLAESTVNPSVPMRLT